MYHCSAPDQWCSTHIGKKLSGLEMKTANKVILINCGIVAGLALELYQGASLKIVGSAGALLFLLANSVIYFAARRKRPGA
jgi:hypothetical protein